MKTIRNILSVLFMAVASVSMAQVSISTSQLNGTKWRIEGSTSGSFDQYTTSQIIWHRRDSTFSVYPYYLTDTPITSYEYSGFDHSKVGRETSGRYIVTLNTKRRVVYCSSIQSFDKTRGTFIIKLVTNGLIGIGDGISTYEIVK